MSLPNRLHLLGVPLSPHDNATLLAHLCHQITQQEKTLVLSGNIHSFNLAYENDWLRHFFNRADIIRLDGAGVRLGAKILGHNTPPRMTWADFAWDLAALCEQNNFSLFFLGAKPGVAQKAAEKLRTKHPNLRFVGFQDGYFDKTKGSVENTAVVQAINTAQPDILVIGFGMPLQEKWLSQNWDELNVPVTMTGGAVFDYISGELTRPPQWMTDNGLEWLGRMLIEPRRLWKRYIIGNPKFFWRILRQRLGLLKLGKNPQTR